ncbi:M3 family oligoendopeptidase [Fibrobacter sp. UWH1]|uniref:M3 family oligoendopeptidase n=1 Tax=Fibrobacter sp. UWH1 TaxID=1964354 RepID=UPI001130AA46|nr:M3 family oligoendopeptidase [Fibrobacter sp. UWH1]
MKKPSSEELKNDLKYYRTRVNTYKKTMEFLKEHIETLQDMENVKRELRYANCALEDLQKVNRFMENVLDVVKEEIKKVK